MRQLLLSLAVLTLQVGGCSSDPADTNPADALVTDSASEDTTIATADTGTASADATDTSVADAAVDAARFDIIGDLTGPCGTLIAQLASKTSSVEYNLLTFKAGEKYARDALSPDGKRIYDTPNAGGSSEESEVMSFEVLLHCEGAKLLKTETEVKYTAPSDAGANSITDVLIELGGKKVGLQITRPYKPAPLMMTDAEVKALLEKKLEGIIRSTARVLPEDKWVKQILHVFVATEATEAAVKRVLLTIDTALKSDTIILVTRTVGGGFLYCNPDPPLGSECPPI